MKAKFNVVRVTLPTFVCNFSNLFSIDSICIPCAGVLTGTDRSPNVYANQTLQQLAILHISQVLAIIYTDQVIAKLYIGQVLAILYNCQV